MSQKWYREKADGKSKVPTLSPGMFVTTQYSCGSQPAAVGRGPLHLEEQVRVIPVPPTSAKHGADVPVDGLDHPEGDLHVAIGQDAIQVGQEQLRQLLEGGEPLPPEGQEPGGQEAASVRLVRVRPELRQLIPEQVRLGQAAVDREEVRSGSAAGPGPGGPTA